MDFSAALVDLVTSTPGRHRGSKDKGDGGVGVEVGVQGEEGQRYGLWRIKDILTRREAELPRKR